VDRWVHPEEFARWKELGESFGIAHVEAGPLVRSSYHAGRMKAQVDALG
jgi:lipoic acid synthetase